MTVSENDNTITLFVGWLNVITCFAVPSVLFFMHMSQHHYDLSLVLHNEYLQFCIIYCACGFGTWFIVSMLLLIGIKQERRKFMVPWLVLNVPLVIITFPLMVHEYVTLSKLGYDWDVILIQCLPHAIALVFLILCFIPVCNMYRHLSKPPQVLTTSSSIEVKQSVDDKRYMPIFDN